ncbi:relaxase/mobilization nuclease domain-containing protein [Eubacterium aggregans]|uniref:relaxase/mobilization nuclease domain-containing protein n=1 Tax=Eubacterium aggregans TaxID=81409 RepID=UPI003F3919A6
MIKMIPHRITSDSRRGVKKILKYIENKDKTSEALIESWNCSSEPDVAVQEMMLVKAMNDRDKEGQNRFYVHFSQPFTPGTVSADQAHHMGIQLIESNPEIFAGYQVVMATHTDQAHLHNHFILNTVNQETGKMWHQTKKDLQSLKEKDIEICKACGLEITWHGKGDKQPTQNRGEYEALKRGVSCKQEMSATVEYCLTKSVDQWDFMMAMKMFGYRINWWADREDITIISPEGWRCGSCKLNKDWTQEMLSAVFELNRGAAPVQSDYAAKRALSGKTEGMIRAVSYAIYEAEDRQ